ncbi:MAG: 2-C-methyl-D-erythritol 4-phosphate cytidylyltransferase [Pseudomonadota bacterium]
MTDHARTCWAVVPAAGIGSRMGAATPKQYLEVEGKTILEHSISALLGSERIAKVIVALAPRDERAGKLAVLQDDRIDCVEGGEQRSDSVLAALELLRSCGDLEDWVLVHDAARPCLDESDLNRLIETVMASDIGGILAERMADTVKMATDGNRVLRTLDRNRLWRAQTPQMFRLGPLLAALQSAAKEGVAITDEASAMELAGHPVQLVEGSPGNMKVTLPAHLALIGGYLREGGGTQ